MRVPLDVQQDASRGVISLYPRGYAAELPPLIHRTLPAAHWDKRRTCWEMPDTAGARLRLHESVRYLELAATVKLPGGLTCPAPRPPESDAPLAFTTPTAAWRHQRCAHHFLAWARENLGAALLDMGMRTGKTRVVLDHLQSLPPEQRRGLVVAPKSVVPVWAEQAAQHTEAGALSVVAVEDGKIPERVAETVALLNGSKPTVVVLGWSVLGLLSAPDKQALRDALRGATVIADEVHYAKTASSLRAQNLALIAQYAAMRIGASGTPLAHSPLDAYAVFRFLDPGVWGVAFSRFRDRYAMMGGFRNKQVLGFRNLDDLAARMAPYTFRATRDVLELPAAQHIDVNVPLPASWKDGATGRTTRPAELYESMRDDCVADLSSGTLTAPHALTRLLRLAQITSGHLPQPEHSPGMPPEIIHTAKQEALVDLLESCDPSEPWVVFGRFHHDLDAAAAAAALVGRPCFELSGRQHNLDEWRLACKNGRGPVLAAQIQTGGIGISLVEAAFCCYLSVGYSLAEWEQSLARIHGPEQTRPVAYYHVVCKGTVDVDIRRALARRADVLEYVKGALVQHQPKQVA